jgi:hypothetical protein
MKGYQFSLRTLLAAVAVVGIGAALWTAEPSWKMGAVEFLLVPSVLASAAILTVRSKGTAKAFWMGCAVECIWPFVAYLPAVLVLYFLEQLERSTEVELPDVRDDLLLFFGSLDGISYCFRPVLLAWAFAPIVGLLCVLTHWLFIRSADPAEPKD